MDASDRARAAAAIRAGVERGDPLIPAELAENALAPADDERETVWPAGNGMSRATLPAGLRLPA